MSEYSEKHSVSRLVGAPPGYVGYDEGGQLTEAVRRRPYSVVLLDEVEKAHPEVFDILLQVLDDGRLTDGQGRTVDFRNTLLILTSNLGSTYLVDPMLDEEKKRDVGDGGGAAGVQAGVPQPARRDRDVRRARQGRARAHRRPADRGARPPAAPYAGSPSTVTDGRARAWLALTGYDPAYGARPLRRLVQTAIGDPLARMLLGGEVLDGGRSPWTSTPPVTVCCSRRQLQRPPDRRPPQLLERAAAGSVPWAGRARRAGPPGSACTCSTHHGLTSRAPSSTEARNAAQSHPLEGVDLVGVGRAPGRPWWPTNTGHISFSTTPSGITAR